MTTTVPKFVTLSTLALGLSLAPLLWAQAPPAPFTPTLSYCTALAAPTQPQPALTPPVSQVVILAACPPDLPQPEPLTSTPLDDGRGTMLTLPSVEPHPLAVDLIGCWRPATGADFVRWATGQPLTLESPAGE
jgi:hypothetical protein